MVDLRSICEQFDITGDLIETRPHGGGYINDTYLGLYQTPHGICRYVHQRINRRVFREPEKVMENIDRVTRYAAQQIRAAGGDPQRETLRLIPTHDGQICFRSADGETWRTYAYIEGARTYEIAENLQQVYAAANAFGRFQTLLACLPGPRLHETIPGFHHTRQRFEAFQQALQEDRVNRAAGVQPEIHFLLQREADAAIVVDLLAQGSLPERVTHNDTKLNNVLIDDQSRRGICVIDLDTTMPGSTLYDFGDLIRMGTATAGEDERDLAKVGIDLQLFSELARGYLDATRDLLVPLEWDLLAFAGRLITYEQAMRFLGDYLNGDTYYKTQRPGQNLDRARTQIKMLAEMERKQSEMERTLRAYR